MPQIILGQSNTKGFRSDCNVRSKISTPSEVNVALDKLLYQTEEH